MANKLVIQFKSLPKWGQGAIVVGGVVVAYLLYKRFLAQPIFSSKHPKRLRTDKDIENQGNTIPYVPTPYVLDYNDLAKQMFDAFNGSGTDEDKVLSIIYEMRNQADWNALQKAYGVRKTSGYFVSSFSGNLKATINDELSNYWIQKIKDTLATKNISY
jgi:hypothetical protein